jgi:hypothetical protein
MTRIPLPTMPNRLDPIPGRPAAAERTLGMILALTSELTVLRARLDACERLLAEAGVLAPGAVDAFQPDPAAQAERETLRGRTMAKVLRPMQELAQRELAEVSAHQRAPAQENAA